MSVIDNTAENRFELTEAGATAFANYRREQGKIFILHVEAPEALRGKGTASRLMQGIFDMTKTAGAEIVPVCPYAVHWINKNGV